MPFYPSYDSADVWSHPDIFSVNEEHKITAMAGVPPDYFSSTGQLWGMPTYNWKSIEEQKYDWWIQRVKKVWNCLIIYVSIIFVRWNHIGKFLPERKQQITANG